MELVSNIITNSKIPKRKEVLNMARGDIIKKRDKDWLGRDRVTTYRKTGTFSKEKVGRKIYSGKRKK